MAQTGLRRRSEVCRAICASLRSWSGQKSQHGRSRMHDAGTSTPDREFGGTAERLQREWLQSLRSESRRNRYARTRLIVIETTTKIERTLRASNRIPQKPPSAPASRRPGECLRLLERHHAESTRRDHGDAVPAAVFLLAARCLVRPSVCAIRSPACAIAKGTRAQTASPHRFRTSDVSRS